MSLDELEKALEIYPEYLYKHYELRPCPFCCGKPIIDKNYTRDGAGSHCTAGVYCAHCGAGTPMFRADNSDNVELWQTSPKIFRIYQNTNPVEAAVKAWNGELDL